jgi:hypothetical protein
VKQVVKAVIRMQRDVEEWEVVSKWCSCNFTGEESFNEVKVKLKMMSVISWITSSS